VTVLIGLETAALLVLALLVAGLLRSHATVLRRLDALSGSAADVAAVPRVFPGVAPAVPLDTPFVPAQDVAGVSVTGEAMVLAVREAQHDTVLVFLSSQCATCQSFWQQLGRPGLALPDRTRLVIVTKSATEESPSAIAAQLAPHLDVVMSSQAWADYRVPGSPYVVAVDGARGRVVGEGTGMSWDQVVKMLVESTGDIGFLQDVSARRGKPEPDTAREIRVDRELMASGILPGDRRLYPAPTSRSGQS
jgi:hypothetical protein